MTAILYNNVSDNREINKNITEITSIELTLYLDTNILNPVFKVKTFNNNGNYLYVPTLNRYYYINNYTLSNQCVYLHCSVDVLMSYKNTILNSEVLVYRNEFIKDLRLQDTNMPISCKKQIQIEQISEQFINNGIGCYIIGVM